MFILVRGCEHPLFKTEILTEMENFSLIIVSHQGSQFMKFKPLFVSVLFLLIGSSLAAQTCKTDPNNCTPSDLCKQATESFDNQRYWIADEKNPYLVLARKFGLDCNALEAATDCTKDASKCTISDLCQVTDVRTYVSK